MKGLRGLFRLGTLTLLALTLMVALALPTAAAGTCSSTQMLGEVEIVSVEAKESPASWSAQDLVNFGYDGDIENGLLEIKFKDIATDFDFDGYIIEAVPGNDDPGNSDDLGVADYKSDSLIARPAVVGSTITEVLNLEPGTKYYVTVYAVNHNTVQISPDQRPQDSSSNTTLLSAPFLGALAWGHPSIGTLVAGSSPGTPPVFSPNTDNQSVTACTTASATCGLYHGGMVVDADLKPTLTTSGAYQACSDLTQATCTVTWRLIDLQDDDYKGTHFALYGARDEDNQHYFRWLNPGDYGPFDHILDKSKDMKQADMLSMDKDGDVEDHCADDDINGDCGHTHYQFKAVDDKGNTVASELVETMGELTSGGDDFFQTVFTAESGDLTLSVSLGRMVGGKYKAMSDTASVMFEAPDDLRALDQTYEEYTKVNMDITTGVDDTDEVDGYRDSVFSTKALTGYDNGEELKSDATVKAADTKLKMVAYLNNQLK